MAYNLTVGDVIEVSFSGRLFGQRTLNIRHYSVTTLAGAHTAAERFDAWFNNMAAGGNLIDKIRNVTTNLWTLEQVIFQRIRPIRNARYPKVVNLNGIDASGCKEANVAAVITLRTDKATVENPQNPAGQVGAWHHPGVPLGTRIDGYPTPRQRWLTTVSWRPNPNDAAQHLRGRDDPGDLPPEATRDRVQCRSDHYVSGTAHCADAADANRWKRRVIGVGTFGS